MMKGKKMTIAVTLIYLVLLIPFLQYEFQFAGELPLKGDVEYFPDMKFSVGSWKDESFQKAKEKYLNQQFGFRNFFVRLNNQIYYSIFCQAKANGVVVGKQGYLYEENYINDYKHTFCSEAVPNAERECRVTRF